MNEPRVTKRTEGSATALGPFLTDVAVALEKRRKAIRHKVRDLRIERAVDRLSADEPDKLEVSAKVGSAKLRMFVWEDRWVFVDARTPTKVEGWLWESTQEGRLIGGDVQVLVSALEASVDATRGQSSDDLSCLWDSLLAKGPRLAS
jgi:hypothetical protein